MIANAGFELVHARRPALEIALDYGFSSPDTFTRAFRRLTGAAPSEFRRSRVKVGRVKLTGGVWDPGLRANGEKQEDIMNTNGIEKGEGSCVLYGIRRVAYSHEECTPFPACLRSCLNYLGQEIDYRRLMAATGAAFRLRWNEACWDGGNVDIMYVFERSEEAFERGFAAAGRSFRMLARGPETKKQDFFEFLKAELDDGRPVIALGIIGPPEACIVAGYRDEGRTLLGWNFFQEMPEFRGDAEIDESGYFATSSWWENPQTRLLIAVGEERAERTSDRAILAEGLEILERRRVGTCAGGSAAYEAWARAIGDDSEFLPDAPLPALFERLMCQVDAVTMVGEGRAYAAGFLRAAAADAAAGPEAILDARALERAAVLFDREAKLTHQMCALVGGFQMGEKQARTLAKRETRRAIVELILQARDLDAEAAAELRAAL